MKKGIKYAGIAAATLLTVAPVVAPVVGSTTQIVQAAEITADSETTKKDEVLRFLSLFKDKKINNFSDFTKNSTDSNYGVDQSLTTFSNDENPYFSARSYDAKPALSFGSKATIKTVLTDGTNDYTDVSDVKKLIKNTTKTIQVKYIVTYDADTTESGKGLKEIKTITLTKTDADTDVPEVKAPVTELNATYTNPLKVAANTDIDDITLSTSSDVKVTDQNGNKLSVKKVKVGNVYSSVEDAKTPANKNAKTGKFTSKDIDKTYYQTLTVSFNDKALGEKNDDEKTPVKVSDINTNYTNSKDGNLITINGSNATASQYDGTSEDLVLVRSITVGKEVTNDWSVEDYAGVVIVNDKIAKLVNGENKVQPTRSLAANSGWATDKKRTNKAGDVQYRVSTDEWVNAKDVTVEGLSTSDPATSFTDVQKFETPKVITLDGPTGFVYTLYTSKGEAKSDRGLGGESAWLADRSAKNAKGQTVYRVSTDEWVIAGTGVHVN